MSLLDYLKPTLAPNVWVDDGETLAPSVESQILSTLNGVFEQFGTEMSDFVADIYIIGGITSHQWVEDSDVDVTVVVRDDVTDEAFKAIRRYVTKNLNGEPASGTQHPVNYFFKKKSEFTTDVAQAVYDVVRRKWLYKDTRGQEYDPEAKYEDKLATAKQVASNVIELMEELKRDLLDLADLKDVAKDSEFYRDVYYSKQSQAWADVENLQRLYHKIHSERNKAFADDPKGGNESLANIIYKYLERYSYLSELKDILDSQEEFIKGLSQAVGMDIEEVLEPKPSVEEAEQQAKKEPSPTSVREKTAALCHEQWSGWMKYLFSKSTENEDGSVTIPKELVERWKRQTAMPYMGLSGREKDSDRKEADKFLKLLKVKDNVEL